MLSLLLESQDECEAGNFVKISNLKVGRSQVVPMLAFYWLHTFRSC